METDSSEPKAENQKKPLAVLSIRDAEGAEGGAKHGSEADPGASPTAVGRVVGG